MSIRLSNFKIRAYRSCRNTALAPHPRISVLIGPNGSGKTNILQAILLLKKLASGRGELRKNTPGLSHCIIDVIFEISKKKLLYKVKVDYNTDEKNDDEIISVRESLNLQEFDFPNAYLTPSDIAEILFDRPDK